MTSDQLEELYALHDELKDDPIRSGDRSLADDNTFRRLFMWQFTEYQRLLLKCMKAYGKDCAEFKQARKWLRNAEFVAKGKDGDVRLATARAEAALMKLHNWMDRARKELKLLPKSL